MKSKVLRHRFPFFTVPGPLQAKKKPNYLFPDSQTFPNKVLSVGQVFFVLSKVLTHTLNKILPRRNSKCNKQDLVMSSVRGRNLINT